MVTQTGKWAWKLDRESIPPELRPGEFNLHDLEMLSRAETNAATRLNAAFKNYDLDLPLSFWRGARLIRNGLEIQGENPALGRTLMFEGLREYDEGRSVPIRHKVDVIHELLARGAVDQARNHIESLTPDEFQVPFPDDMDVGVSDVARIGDLIEKAGSLNTALASTPVAKEEIERLNEGVSELTDQLDTLKLKVEEKTSQIEKSFKENLALKQPITFWSERAVTHKDGRNFWFKVLLLFLVLFVLAGAIVIKASWGVIPELEPSSLPFVALFLGVPIAAILWAIRIVARVYRNEAAMYDDALERQTMLETYIAMLTEGDMRIEDRDHVLRAVFRPRTIDSMDDGGASPIAQVVQAFRDEGRKERP